MTPIAQICNVIHGWLGWCPNTGTHVHKGISPPHHETTISQVGGMIGDRAIHWLGLFRNQTLLFTIGAFCAGVFMFTNLGGGSSPNLFIIGMIAGVPYTIVVGIWYWRIFNEVLSEGPVVLLSRYDKTTGSLTLVTTVIFTGISTLVLLGSFSGVDLGMTNAFFGGFIAVLFWGQLIAVHLWESGTHRLLHYDGMILQL